MGLARERLKRATAEAHHQLDADIASRDLADPDVYRRFLLGHARVLPVIERALEAAGVERLLPDWATRRRTAALNEDLQALGAAAPPACAAPTLQNEAAVMGALYVLEGSRLGGVVLARQALAGGSAEISGATRYLTHGRGQALWPSFLAVLEGNDAVRVHPDAAEAAALSVFHAFREALQPALA